MEIAPKTYLGFDFGSKSIGIASGESVTQYATPLALIKVANNSIPWEALIQYINDYQPDALVVGWPCDAQDKPLPLAGRVKHFAQQLHEHSQLPIYLENEHLTSKEAKQRLHQRYGKKRITEHKIDDMAACIILESFLQAHTKQQPFLSNNSSDQEK